MKKIRLDEVFVSRRIRLTAKMQAAKSLAVYVSALPLMVTNL